MSGVAGSAADESAGGDARVALVTAPDRAVAERIAEALVDERLIACANLLPGVHSIFRWEGAVERAAEVLVVLKTSSRQVARLKQRLPELHPYDVPELLVLAVEDGHRPYVDWVLAESGGAAG